MGHTIQNAKPLLARIRRIRGQADALEAAIGAGAECIAVLQQIAAIRGAVTGLMSEVIEGHLRDHFAGTSQPTVEQREEMEQLLRVVRSYVK